MATNPNTPSPMPAAIENVIGMPAMMRNAGSADSDLLQSIPGTSLIIR